MRTPIYIRRGNKADLPTLNVGEFGFATDTKELFIGAPGGNVQLAPKDSTTGQILSGGNKMQSGFATFSGTNGTVTFPVAFSSNNVTVVLSPFAFNSTLQVTSATANSFSFSSSVNMTSNTIEWIAIGT